MLRSENISQLMVALVKAQAQMKPAQRSGKNPQLRNNYSTLEDIIAAVKKPFADNALCFVQALDTTSDGVFLETLIIHESGEYIGSRLIVHEVSGNRAVNEIQTFGIALTYTKRYALAALAGIASDDDTDGNGATARNPARRKATRQAPSPVPSIQDTPPEPEPSPDFKQQASMVDGVNEPFIEVDRVGPHPTQKGKFRLGFYARGEKWPRVHVWSADDAIDIVPALGTFYTKEALYTFYDQQQYLSSYQSLFNVGCSFRL